MDNNHLRWGILSTAKIGVEKVIPAMQQGQYSKITAIASRDPERAREVAQSLNIKEAYGSYEELLASPEVDAIYNPLPNHLHVSWSIKALQAGKHVLCEKPLGLNLEDARKLASEASKHPDLNVMEAFMYRHHPRWVRARELVKEGAVGKVQTIRSFFSYYNDDPDNIRNKPGIGGGGLMDIGCYCISVPRFLFDEEPDSVFGTMEMDPELGIDRLTSGILAFPGGTATFTCATQLAPHQSVRILGTEGKMEIAMPFNAPVDTPTTILLTRGDQQQEIRFEPCNQYTAQGDLFSKAVLDGDSVPTPLNDALANMKTIDAVVQSHNEGCWVDID
ncbi:Gfo/Idh/MocA family protein [Fodinibius sediminis]|uniref:Predicted dehydrogenase n=1 Tax=Fodinibius sediminis TaxID=1214077 RepID=A0A521BI80_9BACT|nr:Gfo/Idh/MocA family oxidoreductase [Fodinibius sediminis]SMO46805.1 Predicted dehydrogenase [Fodinibius sediminis]